MRVLHVYRTYFPETQGGLQEAIRQICIGTKPCGVESRVFTLHDGPDDEVAQEEALVVRAHKHLEIASCSIGLRALPQFKKALAWADIVHYHLPWPFADALHVLASVKKPALATYHSDVVRQRVVMGLYGPVLHWFMRQMGRVVCTSPNYLESSPVLARHRDNCAVIPLGLEAASYPQPDEAFLQSVRALYGEHFFLFVGVLRYYKGLHILLQALQGTDIPVVIAGDGPEAQALRDQAQRLGLNNVQFAGYIDDATKVALFKLATAVVFPSHLRSEAFGVTLLEGAMYSCALISTDVGTGTSYVNIDGETGRVIEPDNHEALREAMLAMQANPEQTLRYGRNARSRFEENFTAALQGEAYTAIYRELLTGHK